MLKIGGKIDRVDVLPNGQIEIIDYKTGTIPKDRENQPSTISSSPFIL